MTVRIISVTLGRHRMLVTVLLTLRTLIVMATPCTISAYDRFPPPVTVDDDVRDILS